MSETAVATKPAKAVAPAIPTPAREGRMREAQIKKFSSSALNAVGYGATDILTITAPPGMSFAEAMLPGAWAGVAGVVARDALSTRNLQDSVGCVVVLDSEDKTYMALLRVNGVVRDQHGGPCGVNVMCIGPSIDLKTGEARPIDLKTGRAWADPPAPKEA